MTDFEFRDRDGVTWRIVWRSAGRDARVVGCDQPDQGDVPAGFEFTCEAVTFRAPWPTYTDPRALRPELIQRMIDRALGG
ncbi:MAG: hypothetical protein U5R14_12940 [Gemmatimonadota bacterium]|nr:hypothetical protein [Gemmatimonadota bacterium]